jgi:hypothetical protein
MIERAGFVIGRLVKTPNAAKGLEFWVNYLKRVYRAFAGCAIIANELLSLACTATIGAESGKRYAHAQIESGMRTRRWNSGNRLRASRTL